MPRRKNISSRGDGVNSSCGTELLTPSEVGDKLILLRRQVRPNWRWDSAGTVHQNYGHYSDYVRRPGDDDFFIKRVLPFYFTNANESKNSKARIQLEKKFPDLFWALSLYLEESWDKWTLEALVCGDYPVEKIAELLFTEVSCIEAYEKMFYDIRDRIDNKVYMFSNVFRNSFMANGAMYYPDMLWKVLAWKHSCGPEVFLEVVDYTKAPPPQAQAAITTSINNKMILDTWTAVWNRRINGFNENFVVDQYQRLLELEQNGVGSVQTASQLGVLVDALSGSMRLASLKDNLSAVEPTPDEAMAEVFKNRVKESPVSK